MRKDITIRYICDKCGASFLNEDDCKACETSHRTDAKVVAMEFDEREKYPTRIIVDFGGSKRRCTVFGEVKDWDGWGNAHD